MRVVVHKFGGTSLNDAQCIQNAARQILQLKDRGSPCVVVSAMGGITNRLLQAAKASERCDLSISKVVAQEVKSRHLEALYELTSQQEERDKFERDLKREVSEFETLCQGIHAVRELSPRTLDLILARGERLSSQLMAIALRSLHVKAEAVDGSLLVITDDQYGEACPDFVETEKKVRSLLLPFIEREVIPAVAGFVGGTKTGNVTTLGRGGSDYSAAILGAVLKASEVQVWTDVDGIFTADPKVVPSARLIPQISYKEASELSYYGAKVLHPRTIIPLARLKIPLRIRNSFSPENTGTLVNDVITLTSYGVKAVTSISSQSLITVEGKGMLGVPGIAARVFCAMADEGVSVTMISQSSSENNICFTIPSASTNQAIDRLQKAFATELVREDVEAITSRQDISIVAAVGAGMEGTPGIAAKIFGAMAKKQINVMAIAQGSSELNVSFVISSQSVDEAIRAIHDEFHLDRIDTYRASHLKEKEYDLIFLGFGQIGQTLLSQVRSQKNYFRNHLGIQLNIVEIIDSQGFFPAPERLEENIMDQILKAKANGLTLPNLAGGKAYSNVVDAISFICDYRISRPILLDLSDGADTLSALLEGLRRGCHVVLANKKPIAQSLHSFDQLHQLAQEKRRKLLFETTVGAGLPILNTLSSFTSTGDRIQQVEGCLSGTLGFIASSMEKGETFSSAVEVAKRLGYTEPNPLEDLSGMDVARKALILSRLIGNRMEPEMVEMSPFIPEEFKTNPNEDPSMDPGMELTSQLQKLDPHFEKLVLDAKNQGKVLRYVATITSNQVSIGLRPVPLQSPLAQLSSTDNMVVFTTNRYSKQPLVVRGPGAGASVTAQGVLSDILAITSSE